MRNVTSLKPKRNNDIFKSIPKFTEVFVPIEVARKYAQSIYGSVEVHDASPAHSVQKKLDKAFLHKESPWQIIIVQEGAS